MEAFITRLETMEADGRLSEVLLTPSSYPFLQDGLDMCQRLLAIGSEKDKIQCFRVYDILAK